MASSSATTTENTEVIDRVRSLLQRDKIKLWESPYTNEQDGSENIPEELVETICAELGYSKEEIRDSLSHLRKHALEKLAAKQRADWITLKIRLSSSTTNNNLSPTVSLSPNSTGYDLRKLVIDQLALHDQELKMICSGRVIQLEKMLNQQNIRSNSMVLVIAVPKLHVHSVTEDAERSNLINAVKEATKILDENAHRSMSSSRYQLRLTDQHGRELTALSDNERRSLMIAMTLHEKGRSFLHKRDYLSALALLSEADNEFRQCSSQILSSVDNWGLLNLDIVWCYLCMKNVQDLQDASERLIKCDHCFVKVYGNSFERLKALRKDGMGHIVLFVRLHLLQAIVAYHDGRKRDAKNLLALAEEEAKMMHIDPEKMTQIVQMGYSITEARRSLRSAQGNVDQAVEFILESRRLQEEQRQEEKLREDEGRLQRRYGRTHNGELLNIKNLKQLQSLGYDERLCAEALKQSDNRLEQAGEILLTNPDILLSTSDVADDDEYEDIDSDHQDESELTANTDRLNRITELIALGADEQVANALLKIHNDNLERAASEFFQMSNDQSSTEKLLERAQKRMKTSKTKREKRDQVRQEKLDTIIPELLRVNQSIESGEADQDGSTNYLDALLEEEEAFISEYRQRLIDEGIY